MVYAATGLVLSLTVHLLSYAGEQPGGNALFAALHIGIFPLWIPVVLISKKMSAGVPQKDFWKTAMSDCPTWMKYMTNGFFCYALINFAIFIFHAPKGKHDNGPPPPIVWRGFSGHWMLFYSAGLMVVTTAYRRATADQICPRGHVVPATATACPICGIRMDQTSANRGDDLDSEQSS